MARVLSPIPAGVPVTDRTGLVSDFFRLRWQELRDAFITVPIAGSVTKTGQTAALAATAILTLTAAGWYRVSYVARVTTAAGVSSSLTPTVGWIESGQALTLSGAAMTGNSVTTVQSGTIFVYADANTDLTIATAYASNAASAMAYSLRAGVEQLQ